MILIEAIPSASPTPWLQPSATATAKPDTITNPPPSAGNMPGLEIYGFVFMALMICGLLGLLGYCTWKRWVKGERVGCLKSVIVTKPQYGASVKADKDEAKLEQGRQEDKYTVPPLIMDRRNHRARDRSSSCPIKPVMRQPSCASKYSPQRNASLSRTPSGKRVSWAHSTSTLDADGNESETPIDNTRVSPYDSPRPPFRPIHSPFYEEPLRCIPRGYTRSPRRSVALEPRARRGREMIAATTPDVAASWARPTDDPFMGCTCGTVDPLEPSNINHCCEVHPYRESGWIADYHL